MAKLGQARRLVDTLSLSSRHQLLLVRPLACINFLGLVELPVWSLTFFRRMRLELIACEEDPKLVTALALSGDLLAQKPLCRTGEGGEGGSSLSCDVAAPALNSFPGFLGHCPNGCTAHAHAICTRLGTLRFCGGVVNQVSSDRHMHQFGSLGGRVRRGFDAWDQR